MTAKSGNEGEDGNGGNGVGSCYVLAMLRLTGWFLLLAIASVTLWHPVLWIATFLVGGLAGGALVLSLIRPVR